MIGNVKITIVLEDPKVNGVRAGLNRNSLIVNLNGIPVIDEDLTIDEETEKGDSTDITTKLTITYEVPFERLNLGEKNIVTADIEDNVGNRTDHVEKIFTLNLEEN